MTARRRLKPKQLVAAAVRVTEGESVEAVAREFQVSPEDLARWVEDLVGQEIKESDLRPILESLAAERSYRGEKATFEFPGFDYTPDYAWFAHDMMPRNLVAIFELDKGVSPKHLTGGIVLANMVALKYSKRGLPFFEITRRERMAVARIEALRTHLAENGYLSACVVGTFDPKRIRDRVRSVLQEPQ